MTNHPNRSRVAADKGSCGMDIAERHMGSQEWTITEASETGHLVPQRIIDEWAIARRDAADEIQRLRVLFRANMLHHAPQTSHSEIDAVLFPQTSD